MGVVSGTPARRSRVGSSRVIGGQSASREEKLQKEEREGGQEERLLRKEGLYYWGGGDTKRARNFWGALHGAGGREFCLPGQGVWNSPRCVRQRQQLDNII